MPKRLKTSQPPHKRAIRKPAKRATSSRKGSAAADQISFGFHPRVFESLGSDLVTNDLVAITELVKNSYDAFASRVDIRFLHDPKRGPYIEIEDDGSGMSKDIVRTVWAIVATPHRETNTISAKDGRQRRVSGEKGLGRLSVARLGDELVMFTKAAGHDCLKLSVDWSAIRASSDIKKCVGRLVRENSQPPINSHGTILQIYALKSEWSDEQRVELTDYLSRLISPFHNKEDFQVWLHEPGAGGTAVRIKSSEFLDRPKYRATGELDNKGQICIRYEYTPVNPAHQGRTVDRITLNLTDIQEKTAIPLVAKSPLDQKVEPICGPFQFEIRAWDIGPNDTKEIAEQFSIRSGLVRKAIKYHKGISVYRDGILVLPKSDSARDWLGLDLRRVSELGTRLSTSQIIGYVAITAEDNPDIKDTSDRERLVDNRAVKAFQEIIKYGIIEPFEQQRQVDRVPRAQAEKPLQKLFDGLKGDALRSRFHDLVRQNAEAKAAEPIIDEFSRELDDSRAEIERRFVYYSRLATVGILAQMLVHEVLSRTTIISDFLSALEKDQAFVDASQKVQSRLPRVHDAVHNLEQLAETFLPLASRNFSRRKTLCVLEDRIAGVLAMLNRDIEHSDIKVTFKDGASTAVVADAAEVDAVLFNLLSNAIYWTSKSPKGQRNVQVRLHRNRPPGRVTIIVNDSGPGIPEDSFEEIFWPGVTKKPGGIGMGLTIAAEIVNAYDGQLGVAACESLGGASFKFDLPQPKP